MAGTLYLVATPIGNLEDITYRAVRILQEAGLIACEDTRQTRKLLDRHGIRGRLVSYHEHNEQERAEELLVRLREGTSVALVSDAGTPLVSDPGYRLVSRAIEEGVRIEPVPGPSALLAALTASGLPTDTFYFGGFLPAKASQRRKTLEKLKDEQATLVFYEAPHRILRALEDVEAVFGERRVALARELTKVHEEFLRGSPAFLRQTLAGKAPLRGEFTLLIAKADAPARDSTPVRQAVEKEMCSGRSRMDAIKAVARRRGLSKREIYRLLQEDRNPEAPSGPV